MKYLTLLLALTIASCSNPAVPECEEYTFERQASYNGVVAYIFDRHNTNFYFQSIEPLDLGIGESYCIEHSGGFIISIQ